MLHQLVGMGVGGGGGPDVLLLNWLRSYVSQDEYLPSLCPPLCGRSERGGHVCVRVCVCARHRFLSWWS